MWIIDVIHVTVVNSLQERRILLVVAHVHKTVSPVLFINTSSLSGQPSELFATEESAKMAQEAWKNRLLLGLIC
jgi:hypothetical protein